MRARDLAEYRALIVTGNPPVGKVSEATSRLDLPCRLGLFSPSLHVALRQPRWPVLPVIFEIKHTKNEDE